MQVSRILGQKLKRFSAEITIIRNAVLFRKQRWDFRFELEKEARSQVQQIFKF